MISGRLGLISGPSRADTRSTRRILRKAPGRVDGFQEFMAAATATKAVVRSRDGCREKWIYRAQLKFDCGESRAKTKWIYQAQLKVS